MATYYLNFQAASGGNGSIGTPWNDFDIAQAGIAPGDTVNVSGIRRGDMVLNPAKGGASPAAKTKWLGTLGAPFVVTGGEVLTGWQQCVAGDFAAVGANYASIWKVNVPKTFFPGSDPFSANLCEASAQIPICLERKLTADKFFLTLPTSYHTADAVALSGALLSGFYKPSVTDQYTQAQIEGCKVYFTASPNVAVKSDIASFDPLTKYITLVTPATYDSNSVKDNFALANLLPAMKRGEWGFKDLGTTVTVYCWPENVGNLAGNIEYSARSSNISINGTSNVEIGFFRTRGTATAVTGGGNLFNSGLDCSNVYLHNFESTDTLNFGNNDAAAVYMQNVDDLEMSYFDVRRAQGMFGVWVKGSNANAAATGSPGSVNLAVRPYVHHGTVAYTSSGPVRLYTVGNGVFAFLIYWECARQSHGNTMNAYQGCYNLLWWGIDGEDADGFFTEQETDGLVMAFCSASASRAPSGGARGIYQQQNSTLKQGSVYGWKGGGVINCRTTPNRADAREGSTNSLRKGSSLVPLDLQTVVNNIYHGHSAMTTGDFAACTDWDNNITTADAIKGAADELVPMNTLYVPGATNKFVYPASSRARSKTAKNMATYMTALQARFSAVVPAFTDYDKDMVGDVYTWANIGCGPTKNKDAPYGQSRGISYAGIAGGNGGGGGEPTRPLLAPGFKIKVAA